MGVRTVSGYPLTAQWTIPWARSRSFDWPPRLRALDPSSQLAERRTLECNVRRDDYAAESPGVGPSPAEGVGCGRAASADAEGVLVVDVQPRRPQELVVEQIQSIATQGQAHAFVKLEGLLDAGVNLVERLCASHVAADGAGKWVAPAEVIDREGVVDDEMDRRGAN